MRFYWEQSSIREYFILRQARPTHGSREPHFSSSESHSYREPETMPFRAAARGRAIRECRDPWVIARKKPRNDIKGRQNFSPWAPRSASYISLWIRTCKHISTGYPTRCMASVLSAPSWATTRPWEPQGALRTQNRPAGRAVFNFSYC